MKRKDSLLTWIAGGKLTGTFSALTWICKVASKTKWAVVELALIQMLQGLAAVAKTLLLGHAVNSAVSGDKHGFLAAAVGFAVLAGGHIALGAFYRFLKEMASSELENRFKSRLFTALLKGSYAETTHVHSGEWMNRLTSDTTVVSGAVVGIFPEFVGLVVRLTAALAAVLWMEPRLVLFLLAGGVVLVVLTRVFRKIMKNLHKEVQETDGRLRVFLQERLGSLLIIKSFVQEERTSVQAEDFMNVHKNARMKRTRFLNLFYSGYSAGINGVYVLGVFFCGFGILKGTMNYGNLVVLLQLLEQMQGPFASITGFFPRYYAMIASAERLREAEIAEEEPVQDTGINVQNFYRDEFRAFGLKKAAFTYEPPAENEGVTMPVIIKDLSFEVKKGEQVVFTGPSGCGKSTVLKLLMNLYPLDSGEAYFQANDGVHVLTAGWRWLFAYVPQGNQLLNGSIREIIAFGDEQEMKNEEKMQLALKIACADRFVNELENGLDTVLGERGAGLSEGQMQRIAIARAVFSGHPVLLFDEATSAIDEATADRILTNIKTMTDKTVIMVTHSMQTVRMFSKELSFSENGVMIKRNRREDTEECK